MFGTTCVTVQSPYCHMWQIMLYNTEVLMEICTVTISRLPQLVMFPRMFRGSWWGFDQIEKYQHDNILTASLFYAYIYIIIMREFLRNQQNKSHDLQMDEED